MSTWRDHQFTPGVIYKIKADLTTATSGFIKGEQPEFVETTYSRYDSSSGFVFRSKLTGEMKTWFLHDDEDDRSNDFFQLNETGRG
jgi:hypothetical protein